MATTLGPAPDSGHDIIDAQHHEIGEVLLELTAADPASHRGFLRLLDRMVELFDIHFIAEERLMRQVGYPPTPTGAMVDDHRAFARRNRLLVLEFRDGAPDPLRARAFLTRFIQEHESDQDRPLLDWIDRKLVTTGDRELRFFTNNLEVGGRVEIARLEYSEGIPSVAVSHPDLLNTDLVHEMLVTIRRRTGLDTKHISWCIAE